MNKTIEYKLFYKYEGTDWKHYFFEAISDDEAKTFAESWTKKNLVVSYEVEKITKEKIV